MNRSNFVYVFVLAIPLGLVSCTSGSFRHTGRFQLPQPIVFSRSFRLRPYSEDTLKNGLRVVYVPDRALPYFSLQLLVKAGSARDPKWHPGTALMVSHLLSKGTPQQTAPQIADSFGAIGSEFNTSVSTDYTLLSSETIAGYQTQLLDEFSSVVMHPSFTRGEVIRTKREVVSEIDRLPDAADSFAYRAFLEMLYGKQNPYGHPRTGTVASISKLRRKDIIEYYLDFYRPQNSILAVVGTFPDNIKDQIKSTFGPWKKMRAIPKLSPVVFPKTQAGPIELVAKPGLTQAQIIMGGQGIRRQDPDFLPVRIANTILGGAYDSELTRQIRIKRSLTYDISSYFDARLFDGPFVVSTFTRNPKVADSIREIRKVLANFYKQGVSTQQVVSAKSYLLGLFPSAIETAERLGFNLLILRLYQVHDSYLRDYLRTLSRIPTSAVNRAIHEHFNPAGFKTLVYGDEAAVLPQLKSLGPVRVRSFISLR